MDFAEAVKRETEITRTENGCIALNTTENACLDLFSTIGALRDADEDRICRLFDDAYNESPLLAMKILFYARDIRGGSKVGERRVFRVLLKHIALHHFNALACNINLIPYYGRWDDYYALIGTPLEDDMWIYVRAQLKCDIRDMNDNKEVSLLAKWLKTADASSRNTRKLGIYTALKLGYKVSEYKKIIKKLRKYIDIVERRMSSNDWSDIVYSKVPSRAMLNYRNAFMRHDSVRFLDFISKAASGEEKINTDALYPYDIVEKIIGDWYGFEMHDLSEEEKMVLNAEWKNLPDYIGDENAIVMADTSGSMTGRPICTSVGLAIYFAQRNKGAYHNLWLSFSEFPKYQRIKGNEITEIIRNMEMDCWGMNTNLESAFELILNTAIENEIPSSELPKSIIVISDMEIDQCAFNKKWTFYDEMADRYKEHGYEIPNIVFWNVASRNDVFHADAKRKGVQLVSGQSVGTFKTVMNSIGMTPIECMHQALNDERYSLVMCP